MLCRIVDNLVHEDRKHPYHIQGVQTLEDASFLPRITFVYHFLLKCIVQIDLPLRIMFTYAASFTGEGY